VALALVFAGGTAGTAAREALSLAFPSAAGIPYATWAINVAGSLALGLLLGVLVSRGPGHHQRVRLAVGTGFCGGFTTNSTLAVQAADLAGHGLWGAGVAYALGTLLIGAVAAWVGLAAGSAAVRRRQAPAGPVR
jgi:CrcB protein